MRAVALSSKRNIQLLNDKFINTWVSNIELGRTSVMHAYITKRQENGFRKLDKNDPLIQAVIKGWKDRSPADSLVISTDLEVMGRQPVNEFPSSNWGQDYFVFLQEALAGEYPGLDVEVIDNLDSTMVKGQRVKLTAEKSEQQILNVFRTPKRGHQDYTVIEIDTTAFIKGGILSIDISVGSAEASGSFDLFDNQTKIPTEGVPRDALANAWGISPGNSKIIRYKFKKGQVFKLGATGDWFSEEGSMNAFLLTISIEQGR